MEPRLFSAVRHRCDSPGADHTPRLRRTADVRTVTAEQSRSAVGRRAQVRGDSSSRWLAKACGTSGSASITSCFCWRCCCRQVCEYARAHDDKAGWAPMLKDVLTLVTAFTVAHSITLSLATLKIVSLPPRLIETTIALSIVVAGLRLRYAISRPGGLDRIRLRAHSRFRVRQRARRHAAADRLAGAVALCVQHRRRVGTVRDRAARVAADQIRTTPYLSTSARSCQPQRCSSPRSELRGQSSGAREYPSVYRVVRTRRSCYRVNSQQADVFLNTYLISKSESSQPKPHDARLPIWRS